MRLHVARRPRWRASAVVSLALSVSACETTGAERAEVTAAVRDSAGITVVVNPPQSDHRVSIAWSSDSALLDEEGAPFLFTALPSWAVAALPNGETVALSAQDAVAYLFDGSGGFVGRIGRRGDGPGELRLPLAVTLSGDTLEVFDSQRAAVQRWTGLGDSLLPQLTLPTTEQGIRPLDVRGTDVFAVRRESSGDSARAAIGASADSSPVLSFTYPAGKAVPLPCLPMPVRRPPLLTPTVHAAAYQDRAVVSGSAAYEVWVIEGGRLVRSIRREVEAKPPTDEDLRLVAGTGVRASLGGQQCQVKPRELAELLGAASYVPAIHGITLLSDGSIWVQRTLRGSSKPRVDSFDRDGRYRFTLDANLPVGVLPDGRYLIPVDDESTGGVIVRFARIRM